MNCNECMAHLQEEALTTLQHSPEIASHLDNCASCGAATAYLAQGHELLARTLDVVTPSRPSSIVAVAAIRQARTGRLLRVASSVVLAIAIMVGWALMRRAAPSETRLWTAGEPLVTQTFTLTCLSSEQAANLLRPYMPTERSWAWPVGNGIRAVTVRAPASTLQRVPGVLGRFEADAGAACHR